MKQAIRQEREPWQNLEGGLIGQGRVQTKDVEACISGCLLCARHGPATRSQPLHPILVTGPLCLIGVDFIGPLQPSKTGCKYTLHMLCYFTRFSWTWPSKTANVPDVIEAFKDLFRKIGKPKAVYLDSGQGRRYILQNLEKCCHGSQPVGIATACRMPFTYQVQFFYFN